MNSENIIVIGASAGGFEALKTLVGGLPPGFRASIFIVWHMSPYVRGVLPDVLNRFDRMQAAHAYDGEQIEEGRIYVAPPDHHLIIEDGHMRITRGPKENRFRPAIDPLFRSAAYHYGPDVTGVILSGSLDDGTSGLWTIKHCGGTTIVQDPNDAEVPSMPENAIREVEVDYVVEVGKLPGLLVRLDESKERSAPRELKRSGDPKDRQLEIEIGIAAESNALESKIMDFGELTPYTCPDCHGVLTSLTDGNITRFRCHTGHAFTADGLLASVTESIETSLWTAMRSVDESIILLNHMGDHFAEVNQPKLAALYFRKANDAQARNDLLRRAVLTHEQLSIEGLREASDETGDGPDQAWSARADH